MMITSVNAKLFYLVIIYLLVKTKITVTQSDSGFCYSNPHLLGNFRNEVCQNCADIEVTVCNCPDGFICPNENDHPNCIECPKGFYCASFGSSLPTVCPKNHYCPVGSTFPIRCSWFSLCDIGSNRETNLSLVFCILFSLFTIVCTYLLVRVYKCVSVNVINQSHDELIHCDDSSTKRPAKNNDNKNKNNFNDDYNNKKISTGPNDNADAVKYNNNDGKAQSSNNTSTFGRDYNSSIRDCSPYDIITQEDNSGSGYSLKIPARGKTNKHLDTRIEIQLRKLFYDNECFVWRWVRKNPFIWQRSLSIRQYFMKECTSLLKDISVCFEGASMTGILGPSGAGKSTLLDVLRGKLTPTGGQRLYNLTQCGANELRILVGHAPQGDILYFDATINELFMYRALIFKSNSNKDVKTKVNETLSLLQLTELQNRKISNLSGGQKRRVSMGLEMLKNPSVLLFDEITSGLDSTAARQIVQTMKNISRSGILVINVIHQPQEQIFFEFDKILLLGKGGWVAYSGKPENAVPYIEQLTNRQRDKEISSPDFVVDALSTMEYEEAKVFHESPCTGMRGSSDDIACDHMAHLIDFQNIEMFQEYYPPGNSTSSKGTVEKMDYETYLFEHDRQSTESITDTSEKGEQSILSTSQCPQTEVDSKLRRLKPSYNGFLNFLWFYQSGHHFFLLLEIYLSKLRLYYSQYLMFGLAGLIVGTCFSERLHSLPLPRIIRDECPNAVNLVLGSLRIEYDVGYLNDWCNSCTPNNDQIGQLGMYSAMGVAVVASAVGVGTFGDDRSLLIRDLDSGISIFGLFLAKSGFDFLKMTMFAFFYVSFFSLVAFSNSAFVDMYFLVLGLVYCLFGLSYILSNLMTRINAGITATVAGIVFMVTTGYVFPKQQLGRLASFCFPLWYGEGLFIAETKLIIDKYFREIIPTENMTVQERAFSNETDKFIFSFELFSYKNFISSYGEIQYGYSTKSLMFDIIMLFVSGCVLQILAFLSLVYSYNHHT